MHWINTALLELANMRDMARFLGLASDRDGFDRAILVLQRSQARFDADHAKIVSWAQARLQRLAYIDSRTSPAVDASIRILRRNARGFSWAPDLGGEG